MKDELRAAAERGRKLYKESPAHVQKREQCLIMGLLAEAYLAANPADDEEPWDEAWMRSVGFQTNWREDGIEIGGGGQYVIVRGDGAVTVFEDSNAGGETLYLRHIKTRGQVRRLCAVLEIPLKEQP